MRIPTTLAFIFLTALGAQAAAAARGDIYTCLFENVQGKMLARQVIVSHADGSPAYSVFDAIVDFVHGQPIDATLLADDASRLEMKWTLKVEGRVSGSAERVAPRTVFRLVIFRDDYRARINAQPFGYANRWTADGKCVRARGKL